MHILHDNYHDKFALVVDPSCNCLASLCPLIFHLYLYMVRNPIITTGINIKIIKIFNMLIRLNIISVNVFNREKLYILVYKMNLILRDSDELLLLEALYKYYRRHFSAHT